jgi:putative dimethyl sulfoxide reductase chaperone
MASACGVESDAEMLIGFLRDRCPDDPGKVVEALAVDFARLFIGPGPGLAPPYESVYTSPTRRFYGDALADIMRLLRTEKIAVGGEFGAPADHVAVELSIMRHLVDEHEPQPGAADASSRAQQRDFLNRHVLRWVPQWAADVAREDSSGFYRAAVSLLVGFLRSEQSWLGAGKEPEA